MSDRHPIRATIALLRSLFLVACVAIAAFAVVGYASGWIIFQHDEKKATIEVKTGEIQRSADDAWKKSEELIEDAGQMLQPADSGTSAPDAADVRNDDDGSTTDNQKNLRPNGGGDDEAPSP